ncbi:hypothetical protein [Klebsiella variicola]|uniref:hypothetical protein n=1 Tax=Klebsiella variicola TaxID=244366 RepID=UPI003D0189A6
MVNNNTALRHHFFRIMQAQGTGQIPANTLGDNIDRIMQPSEDVSDQKHSQVTSFKNSMCPDTTLIRQSPAAYFDQTSDTAFNEPLSRVWRCWAVKL